MLLTQFFLYLIRRLVCVSTEEEFKKTVQVCSPYKGVSAPLPCCLSSPGLPPLNIYNNKRQKNASEKKKTCLLNEKTKQMCTYHVI